VILQLICFADIIFFKLLSNNKLFNNFQVIICIYTYTVYMSYIYIYI
jgi:hypothetical protein